MTQFAEDGFALIPEVLMQGECASIAKQASQPSSAAAGTRGLLSHAWCRTLAKTIQRHPALSRFIPPDLVAVQCTYFEKSLDTNWLVPVHQDLSIPVAERVSEPSLTGWSEKEGALYVQAPVGVLEQLVAVRIHIDACGAEDGPLRIVPGSHRRGRISAEEAPAIRQSRAEWVCVAEQGSVLLMRPLLLHASSKATGSSKRRVLHFLFGPRSLPFDLRWHETV
ncbi:phytanoyl-CoA dioxygenase family protein [Uliginosibacterium sp. H3]|uniref:Phytanoyl-CoA dioxygenase family protein n=1 Tax=Uliginosibacterium silvisoli TaxID=3114758 RepID=A0ABU6K1H2_9RHOO|nr:phytanoyl-CoA dioxygenase family protein [Uliginosibacterium sp. H3]